MADNETIELASRYRAVLVTMEGVRPEVGGRPDTWNQLVDEMQRLHLELATTSMGRDRITEMVDDQVATVRLWSATNARAWDPGRARPVLEETAEGNDTDALAAKATLREFDAGRLRIDWVPEER
ncbi:MAG: hypothetical protein MUF83_05295 [Acidimicrobiales bacterium]|nr:hypothetical protein [Acidimicrobiales bacterium]